MSIILVVAFVFVNLASALQLIVVPLIPPLVTNVNLVHYDITGTGTGSSIYVLHLHSTINDTVYPAVRVRYRVQVQNADQSVGLRTIYEGRSNNFRISPGTPPVVMVTSKEFMIRDNPSVMFSRHRSLDWQEEDEFRDGLLVRTMQAGSLVSGNLRYEFFLEIAPRPNLSASSPQWIVITSPIIEARVININSMVLLTPGTLASSGVVDISTPFPDFRWMSDLFPGIYGPENVFELAIYRQRSGRSLRENLTNPVHLVRIRDARYVYPTSAIPLQPGETYLWQVRGLLRGAVDDRIESQVFAFRVRNQYLADPQVQQYLQRLRGLLLGTPWEGMLAQLENYNAGMRIVMDGREIAPEELEVFFQQLLSGGISLENVRIR